MHDKSERSPIGPPVARSLLDRLTEKEREALVLVHRRLSSKEIAQRLNLSPKTVDQRLDNARNKLLQPTRMAAARKYAELAGIPERFPYEPFPVPEEPCAGPQPVRVPEDAVYTMSDSVSFLPNQPWVNPQTSSAPEFWALRLGALPRLVLIVAGAVGLLVFASLGLSLSEGLSHLLGR